MSNTVYITGHKNPDTDSICSAIAYADYKRNFGIDAIASRVGKINRETEFVLNYFGLDAPKFLATVKTQVSDLKIDVIEPVSSNISLKEAWEILKENRLAVLPVQNESGIFCGIVSVSDIANAYMSIPANNTLSTSNTPIENVVKTLDAEMICGFEKSFNGSGKAIIAAMTPGGMVEYIEQGDIVFVGDIKVNQMKAIESGASCIIATCGSCIDKDVIKAAKDHNCSMLVTSYDTFTSARLLYQSIPIEYTMTTDNIVYFNTDDFIEEVKERMLETRFRNFPVLDSSNNFKGFVSKHHLLNQQKKKVILVDHSEKSQAVNGIEQAQILEIIDHHRIGDIQTGSPIYYRNEPTGSTATIVANLYFQQEFTLSPEIAGVLCAAIVSDTIKFKSPTSTFLDKTTAKKLAKIAGIDIDEFSMKMFEAGTTLKGLTTEEIVQSDFKEYFIGKNKIGISQINTTDFASLESLNKSILDYLNGLLTDKEYNILLIIFTDIIKEKTEVLFVESQKGLVGRAFSPLYNENSFHMDGVVSRKKQIVPMLISALS